MHPQDREQHRGKVARGKGKNPYDAMNPFTPWKEKGEKGKSTKAQNKPGRRDVELPQEGEQGQGEQEDA